MGGFKAVERVSALTYDFRGITVADPDAQDILDQAHGSTPEPSSHAVRRMQARQREALGMAPDTSQEEVNRALASKTEDEWRELDDEFTDMISEVCAGRPSRAELVALPYRVRESFYGWILGELNNPTDGTSAGTRRSLAPVKNA